MFREDSMPTCPSLVNVHKQAAHPYTSNIIRYLPLQHVGVEGRTSWKVMKVYKRSLKVMEPDGRFGLSNQV